MIALLVMTDGRDDVLAQTIASAEENLRGPITERWLHDDTGDEDHRLKLRSAYPAFQVIGGGRAGFGGAINRAWWTLTRISRAPWVFHLEDDFTFNRGVDLEGMAHILHAHPHLTQLALRRQPWNEAERAAGGIVECWPDLYSDHEQDIPGGTARWLEHRLFFTTNPSLYRRSLCEGGWPHRRRSEEAFTQQLLENPAATFGFWGARDSGEAVHHIGEHRAGEGY